MAPRLELRETFPGRLILVAIAAVAAVASAVWYQDSPIVFVTAAGVGILLGAVAVAVMRRRSEHNRTSASGSFWAFTALAVAVGVVFAANLSRAVPSILGLGAGILLVGAIASPSAWFRKWSEMRPRARRR